MVVLTTNHPIQSNRTLHDAGARRGGWRGRPRWKRGPFALPKLWWRPTCRTPQKRRRAAQPGCASRTIPAPGHAPAAAMRVPRPTGTPRSIPKTPIYKSGIPDFFRLLVNKSSRNATFIGNNPCFWRGFLISYPLIYEGLFSKRAKITPVFGGVNHAGGE
jgi:hypothetical protein